MVRDTLLKTDRLLTLAPLNRNCTLDIVNPTTRDVLNKLFLTLQHPYVCPIFDLEFVKYDDKDYVVLVQPINQGSIKDLIYGVSIIMFYKLKKELLKNLEIFIKTLERKNKTFYY